MAEKLDSDEHLVKTNLMRQVAGVRTKHIVLTNETTDSDGEVELGT